jgi:hypothetical protein
MAVSIKVNDTHKTTKNAFPKYMYFNLGEHFHSCVFKIMTAKKVVHYANYAVARKSTTYHALYFLNDLGMSEIISDSVTIFKFQYTKNTKCKTTQISTNLQ